MAARRILVVEDDASIRRGVVDALRFNGYEPLEAANHDDGLKLATRTPCDLILLDLVLPGGGGLHILEEARLARPTLPIIVLTALGSEADRVRGLNVGADDYVVKPFSVKELLARVDAVLRRSAERSFPVEEVVFEGGVADLRRCELRFSGGDRDDLSEREIALLRYLATNTGRAVSRDELLANVWRLPVSASRTRTIDMHVARLREKLRDNATHPRIIETVRGKGYRMATVGGAP
jgi:DNA-binding response OmpR family regulator